MPCIARSRIMRWKFLTKKIENPARAKRKSDGISTVFRPILSARTPATGVRKIPGKVKALISRAISDLFSCRAWEIFGNAGVRLATPMTPTRVILKIT